MQQLGLKEVACIYMHTTFYEVRFWYMIYMTTGPGAEIPFSMDAMGKK